MERIAVSTSTFGEFDDLPIRLCKKEGYEVFLNLSKRKLKSDEIAEFAKDAVGLIAGTEIISAEALSKLPYLKAISRCGTGLDNVDIVAAQGRGIEVLNTPDAPVLAVAELTIALMISLLREIVRMDRSLRAGRWEKLMGSLLSGKKVGIIGFGRIGRKVSELLKPFNCHIGFCDVKNAIGTAGDPVFRKLQLDELLETSDIVSLHVPGMSGKPLIGSRELKKMRNGSCLINVSRGGIVDEKALCDELKTGRLSGAALDVFGEEPYQGPLRGLENIILTPHVGSYAKEVRVEMEIQATKNLLDCLRRRK